MILNLFSSRPDHPLGDAKEFKRILAELPQDNSFKALEEVYGWFQSLQLADDFRVDHFFDVVRQLDEAAQPHIRRQSRDYLHSPRLTKSEERRYWTMCYNYWGEVSSLYARCIERVRLNPKDKGSEALKSSLPLAATRLMAARATQLKWVEYRYGPIGEDLWRGLGQPYLVAEEAGYSQKPVQLYPSQAGLTSVAQQYFQALIFYSSSMDSLMPLEIDLADRLIAHFQPGFVFSNKCLHDSVYWVDVASGLPPARLARRPDRLSPSLRFFSPGSAPQALSELMRNVERGGVPADLNLGGEYLAKVLLPVLRHLALYWATEPPQREHTRHAVKTRIAVVQGDDLSAPHQRPLLEQALGPALQGLDVVSANAYLVPRPLPMPCWPVPTSWSAAGWPTPRWRWARRWPTLAGRATTGRASPAPPWRATCSNVAPR